MDTIRTPGSARPETSRTPFHDLRWSPRELADAVPLRLHAPRLHALFADGVPPPPANDAPPPPPRQWRQGYLRRRDLPALLRIHS